MENFYSVVSIKPLLVASQTVDYADKMINKCIHIVAYLKVGTSFCVGWIDRTVIDKGIVMGVSNFFVGFGLLFRSMIHGRIQSYLIWMFLLLMILTLWWLSNSITL